MKDFMMAVGKDEAWKGDRPRCSLVLPEELIANPGNGTLYIGFPRACHIVPEV